MPQSEDVQSLHQDAIVTLFVIDARRENAGILRFVPEAVDGGPALLDEYEYQPFPIAAEGFEWSGKGPLPQPTLSVSALSVSFLSLVIEADNLVGLPIQRHRIYRKHLDDGSDPDPESQFPVDYYVFEQKTTHTRTQLQFSLAVEMDQQGRQIPARQVLRDACTHIYRRWNAEAGAFDYTSATCPYSGSACFNRAGDSVPPAEDACGKRLSDCRLRFGQHGNLPTRAFPGVGRYR
ncbi:phage minor tail protein L [Salinisphaera sp. T31B1]|uniref:phage minor tail protein L n=1 Tax=Salinisphaera sp. T31B1 TaxID=727963 RepID=UPI00333EC55E